METDAPGLVRAATDGSLMRRYQSGDERAASALYARYVRRLRGLAESRLGGRTLAARVDSDDILQSMFRSFFRGAREGMYHAPPGGELWQLLAAMTRHKARRARTHHLADKRDFRATRGCEVIETLAADGENPGRCAELRFLFEELFTARPAVDREIVLLRIEGRQVAEIAQRTSRSKRTVERVLSEVRDELLSLDRGQ